MLPALQGLILQFVIIVEISKIFILDGLSVRVKVITIECLTQNSTAVSTTSF
jgi:hypothetical protein